MRDDTLQDRIEALGFQVYQHPGEAVTVSAEHGDGAADYYELGYPWINPALEALAEEAGGYWEWVNPGAIAFYRF